MFRFAFLVITASLPGARALEAVWSRDAGFAVGGDRLFMLTLDAHLLALEMKTGKVVWDVALADYKEGYAADAETGTDLWRYQTGAPIYAPPTTYMIEARQYVVMPAGSMLTAFAPPAAAR